VYVRLYECSYIMSDQRMYMCVWGEGLQAPTIVDMFEITHCTGDCLRCGRVPYRNGRRNRIPNAQISQINSFFPTIDFVVKTGSKLNNLCITDVATNALVLCRRTARVKFCRAMCTFLRDDMYINADVQHTLGKQLYICSGDMALQIIRLRKRLRTTSHLGVGLTSEMCPSVFARLVVK